MLVKGPDIEIPNPPADGFPSIRSTGTWDADELWLYFVDPTNFGGQTSSRIYRLNVETGVAEIWKPFGDLPQGCRAISFDATKSNLILRNAQSSNVFNVLFSDKSVTNLGDCGDGAALITQLIAVPESSTEFYALSDNDGTVYKLAVAAGVVTPVSQFIARPGNIFHRLCGLDEDGTLVRAFERNNDGIIIQQDMDRLPLSTIMGGYFNNLASDTSDGPALTSSLLPLSVAPAQTIIYFTSRGSLKQILAEEITTLGTGAVRILGYSQDRTKMVTSNGGNIVNIWSDA
jgi:hypothetical protein